MGKSIRNLSPVTRVGLDLAKRVFQVHAADAKGEIVAARNFMRNPLIPFFGVPPSCVVAMEACSSAHHWGGALIGLGDKVRLLLRADDEGRPKLRQADCGLNERGYSIGSFRRQGHRHRGRRRSDVSQRKRLGSPNTGRRQYDRERMMRRRAMRTNHLGQQNHPFRIKRP
jgi:transposase